MQEQTDPEAMDLGSWTQSRCCYGCDYRCRPPREGHRRNVTRWKTHPRQHPPVADEMLLRNRSRKIGYSWGVRESATRRATEDGGLGRWATPGKGWKPLWKPWKKTA